MSHLQLFPEDHGELPAPSEAEEEADDRELKQQEELQVQEAEFQFNRSAVAEPAPWGKGEQTEHRTLTFPLWCGRSHVALSSYLEKFKDYRVAGAYCTVSRACRRPGVALPLCCFSPCMLICVRACVGVCGGGGD